ncbi:MAG: hypothetical protein GX364_01000 [Firmicutes bacterium]|jgi:putative phosphoesterase|nr:hypothetical protein [Bacillota bacterium]
MCNNFSNEKIFEWVKIVFFSVAGMIVAISFFNETRILAGPFEVLVSLIPFRAGNTIVAIPPLGEIKVHTHDYFFQLNVMLKNVDIDLLSSSVQGLNNIESWIEELFWGARKGVALFGLRSLLVAFVGGGILSYLGCTRKIAYRFWKGGGIAAICFLLIVAFTVVAPFNIATFNNPRYSGTLNAAPWALNIFNVGLSTVQNLSEQLETMATNLIYLFDHLENFTPVDTAGNLKILHVSDIHNNPAAIDLIKKVVNVFNIDMVVDTGDITDYGTPLEAELISEVANLPVPYIFVPGNHDAPPVTSVLRENGVLVLDNEIVEVEGVVIAGISDPAYKVNEIMVPDEEIEAYARSLNSIFEEQDAKPHLLAVHHPLLGELLADKAETILCGHTHKISVKETAESVFINAGSTGASGIRGLNDIENVSYSMFILYYNIDDGEDPLLSAGDLINIPKISGGFKLERHLFSEERSGPGTRNGG